MTPVLAIYASISDLRLSIVRGDYN